MAKAAKKKKNGNGGGESKAAKVREYLAAHPEASGAEVAKECGVKPQYVYLVKSAAKKKKSRGAKVKAKAKAKTAVSTPVDVAGFLLAAKEFAAQAGGISQARQALEVLERLLG